MEPGQAKRLFVTFCLIAAAYPASESRPAGAILTCRIQSARSTVRFDAQATGHTVHGATQQVSGEIVFDPEDLSSKAEVNLQVSAASLATGNKVRDKKMRESHLETGTHPFIRFHSLKVEAVAPTLREGETQEMKVTGTLSLHGVQRRITLDV
ncbi:MAG TPA: YceI family protein, partial [Candidatus Polarisedimenticolia bacterium]|nr:YceI family protein [Candidatus Polarisedimenticolia bacterium]